MTKNRKNGKATAPNGRSVGKSRFVMLYKFMTSCPAYCSLSNNARALYIELKLLFNGSNNGDLFMSVRDAAASINVSVGTASKTLNELQEKGFIRPKKRGSFHLKLRHATTWILTEVDYCGTPPTKDFMRWHCQAKKQNPVSNGDNLVSPFG
jgi:DNA-binding transcriptional regulator YhcF (GntR family)